MRRWWIWVFRLGLAGLALAVCIALLVSIGQIARLIDWPITEGSSVVKIGGAVALWGFVLFGLVLLLPSLYHLWRKTGDATRAQRLLWLAFLVTFPFVASYIYFALYLRPSARANRTAKEGTLTAPREV